MNEQDALNQAQRIATSGGLIGNDDRVWTATRFTDGWLVTSAPADPLQLTGGLHILLMDSGATHIEHGSLPPKMYVRKHSRAENPQFLYQE